MRDWDDLVEQQSRCAWTDAFVRSDQQPYNVNVSHQRIHPTNTDNASSLMVTRQVELPRKHSRVAKTNSLANTKQRSQRPHDCDTEEFNWLTNISAARSFHPADLPHKGHCPTLAFNVFLRTNLSARGNQLATSHIDTLCDITHGLLPKLPGALYSILDTAVKMSNMTSSSKSEL